MLVELGVGMTLEGSVQNDGKTITVRLHLDDVRRHQTLWSKEFTGPADSPEPLQTQIALHATDVTRWAVSPRLKDIRSDASLVSAYLEEKTKKSMAAADDLSPSPATSSRGHRVSPPLTPYWLRQWARQTAWRFSLRRRALNQSGKRGSG